MQAMRVRNATLYHADMTDVLPSLSGIDAVVTDPPYGIRFMGRAWDGTDIEERAAKRASQKQSPDRYGNDRKVPRLSRSESAGTYDTSVSAGRAFAVWAEDWARMTFAAMKPGAHLVAFGSPRMFHRLVIGIEDAGFEIRDTLMWVFGSGFPKSKNLHGNMEGWGTALKPAFEPILLARKPLEGTVEQNVAKYGTGALNIDACRVHADDAQGVEYTVKRLNPGASVNATGNWKQEAEYCGKTKPGRWPANLAHDGSEEVVERFPDTPGAIAAVTGNESTANGFSGNVYNGGMIGGRRSISLPRNDSGSAARFFYCAKTSASERGEFNTHPTVKPIALMRWLCTLITPPGGRILDPFSGSMSTGLAALDAGFEPILIEREREYFDIGYRRILDATKQPRLFA